MSLQSKYQNNPVIQDVELFRGFIDNIKIVDIGTIIRIEDGGKFVTVRLKDSESTELRAEVISLGNELGQLMTPSYNQYCLVFFPSSNIELSTYTEGVDFPHNTYEFAKVLPIGINRGNKTKLSLDDKSIRIANEVYDVDFSDEVLSLQSSKLSCFIDMKNGTLTLGSAKNSVTVSDSTLQYIFGATYNSTTGQLTNALVTTDILNTGEVKVCVGVDKQNNTTNGILNIKPDGELTYTNAQGNTQGCSIEIKPSGELKITTKGKISITSNTVSLSNVFTQLKQLLLQFKTAGSSSQQATAPDTIQAINSWDSNYASKFTE